MKVFRQLLVLALGFQVAQLWAMGTCEVDTSQPDFQAGVPTNVLITPPGEVELAGAGSVDQQNENISSTGREFHHFWWYAQTFKAGVSGPLTAADVRIFCSGCSGTPPDITVSIRAVSGGEPFGADLATATIPGFTSPSGGWMTANFASPMTMTAGTSYALVVRASAA